MPKLYQACGTEDFLYCDNKEVKEKIACSAKEATNTWIMLKSGVFRTWHYSTLFVLLIF